jgi:hypothetical protein
MTPEQFEDEIGWLTRLYTSLEHLSEDMVAKWYVKLERFDVDLLHTAIDQYSDEECVQPPSALSL